MDYRTLARLVPLLDASLRGRRIAGASAAGGGGFLLRFGRGTGRDALLLSIDAGRPGIFLPPAGARFPSLPSPLADAIRIRLADAAVAGVSLPFPGDRVVEVAFSAPWPRRGAGPRLLL